MTETKTNVDIALKLAASYCRLHDAQRALEHARAAFETALLGITAGELEHAWQDLSEPLAAAFRVEVRETLARRLEKQHREIYGGQGRT